MPEVTYLSHSSFVIKDEDNTIVIDPFITGNPTMPSVGHNLHPNYIILTHAHGDHLGDAIELAKKNDATIIAVNELANYVASKGCNAHNMHIGGGYNFPFGHVKFTIAHHGSASPDGQYMGEPAGVLVTIKGKTIYHCGDTGLFLDMKLIGERNSIDCMLAPIGDNFTMGIDDAVTAVEFVNPTLAIPMHYNTFPVIQVDPNQFVQKVQSIGKTAKVLQYGESITV
jgi:L-ascorbate metabolism protein UlaG (beta-lactamase superfamily)